MNLACKPTGLKAARGSWADFVWFLDVDVFVTNPSTLQIMTEATAIEASEATVSAPLMTSTGKYSNFWGGMGDDYYYIRTEDYG